MDKLVYFLIAFQTQVDKDFKFSSTLRTLLIFNWSPEYATFTWLKGDNQVIASRIDMILISEE